MSPVIACGCGFHLGLARLELHLGKDSCAESSHHADVDAQHTAE